MNPIQAVLEWLGAAIGSANDFFNSIVLWTLTTVHHIDPVARALFAAVGMFCETSILIGLIVPGDTIVIIASTAVQSPVEYVGLLVAVVLGSLAGESVGFALGRWFGHAIRHSRLGARIGEKNWMRAETYVQRRGGPAVFVSRFLPVLHSLVPLTAGAGEMRYRRFLAWTAPACVIWATAYVTFGTLAAGSYRQLASTLHIAGYLLIGAVVLFFVAALIIRKLLERNEARHWADERPDDVEAEDVEEGRMP